MEIWDTKFIRNETEKLNQVTKSIEIKKVNYNIYSSDLADRNMRKCRTIWRTKRGSGSSHGRSLLVPDRHKVQRRQWLWPATSRS